MVVVSVADHIRDDNSGAAELFPKLTEQNVTSKPVGTVLPRTVETLQADTGLVEFERPEINGIIA